MKRAFAVVTFLLASGSVWAGDYAQAGALAKDGGWEIAIFFSTNNPAVDRSLSAANYILPDTAQFNDIREEPSENAVVLSVTGLATNVNYTVTLTNLQTTTGTALPALPLSFRTKATSWAAVGAQELGFTADALPSGTNAFDLISGGSQMSGEYDESTFVYQTISGDFDKRVRVPFQEGSSDHAKAGLMVRESLDANKARPLDASDPQQAFSRYLQIAVNPTTTAYTDFDGTPAPGANQYQISMRTLTGGDTENPAPADTNAPAYPNAWMRLKRVGQTFHVFRGPDGTNWVKLGSFTFPTTDLDGNPVPPFSTTALVGPNYSPEVSNVPTSTGVQRAFLAQFRDYSDVSGEVSSDRPTLKISTVGAQVQIEWSPGTLQATTNIASGVWVDANAINPLKITPDKHHQFFRARNP